MLGGEQETYPVVAEAITEIKKGSNFGDKGLPA